MAEALYPSKKPEEVSSVGLDFEDALHVELAERERGNRTGSTAVRKGDERSQTFSLVNVAEVPHPSSSVAKLLNPI